MIAAPNAQLRNRAPVVPWVGTGLMEANIADTDMLAAVSEILGRLT